MKKQVLIIHGGTTFDTYEEYLAFLNSSVLTLDKIKAKDWKDRLQAELTEFDVIFPKMPNAKNARYSEWKIWFEKLLPLLNDGVVLIGHSLGGIFLTKYLSENIFPKKIMSLHLVAPPYDTEVCKDSLGDFALSKTVSSLTTQVGKIFLYQSRDDAEVPFADAEKYKKDLPTASLIVFENRGHFSQETFPELMQNIQELS